MASKNILLVSFDDAVAPWPYLTAFGEPLQIPNLEALCKVATTFQSAYAQAPICGPSRASMMTAQLPHQLDILTNATFVFDRVPASSCWVADLKSQGYFCSCGGKVHHKTNLKPDVHETLYSDAPKQFTGDLRLPRELRKRSRSFGGHRNGRGALDGDDDDFFYDKQSADSAIDFLTTYSGDQPFYREVGFYSAHGPHLTPARFKAGYEAGNLYPPSDWRGYIADSPYVTTNILENEKFRDLDYWQKSVRNYFSAFTHGDYHLGRILDALKASSHAANTVVIIVSDHGFHLGNRNLFRKTTLWEQSLHVPFIIYDPDFPQGQVIQDPTALIDLGPTILDYAGVALPRGAQGRSLRPMLAGARDPDRVIPSFYTHCLTIRRGDYRLIRYGAKDWQLFDVASDYWQLKDLGTTHPKFAPMRKAMEDWAVQNGYTFTDPATSAAQPEDEDA